MFNKKFYFKGPIWWQNLLVTTRGLVRKLIREKNIRLELKQALIENERDPKALADYHDNRLNDVLSNAQKNVPFYRDLLESSQLDLNGLPLIDKSVILKQPEAFRTLDSNMIQIDGSTSGTTGTPLRIPQSMTSVIRERAFVDRMHRWAGIEKGDKIAWLRGDPIVPVGQNKAPYWRYSRFEYMILLSSFHMSAENLPLYIQAMVDYNVAVIQAYPSSIITLAKYLASKNEFYPGKLKSILTSSETLSLEDRKIIEERFQCKVFDWYGLFERVAAISNCEHGRYHVLTDYSHVEFIPVADGKYEIVGTNFNNFLYPLIRYKTGDFVYLSEETECPCGRNFPMIDRIEGRTGDYLLGDAGQKVFILNHIPKGISGLLACQFVQHSAQSIQILVVVNPAQFDSMERNKLIKNAQQRLGSKMNIEIKTVDSIPRTKNGKVKQAICTVSAGE